MACLCGVAGACADQSVCDTCRESNWGALQVGITVYLEGDPALLAARVHAQDGGASRPLLSSGGEESEAGTAERLEGILAERAAKYQAADCVVSLHGGDSDQGASAPEVRRPTAPISWVDSCWSEGAQLCNLKPCWPA